MDIDINRVYMHNALHASAVYSMAAISVCSSVKLMISVKQSTGSSWF